MPPVVVALAWDRLTPEGRVLAQKAAQSFVSSRQSNELVGVFIVDQALETVEGYTTEEAKLKAAVDRVAGTASTQTGASGSRAIRGWRSRPCLSRPARSLPVRGGSARGRRSGSGPGNRYGGLRRRRGRSRDAGRPWIAWTAAIGTCSPTSKGRRR